MRIYRGLRLAVAGIAMFALGVPQGFADDYPSKPITLIIPLGAGGSHDLNARVFTSVIPTYLGQPMVVKLMPGASGQKGTAAAATAAPDGYTLLFTHNYFDQLQQHVEQLPYDPMADFETVARLNFAQASIVVRADKPWKTLDEMLEYGRENPGKLVFGHSGNWGAIMVPGAQLLSEAGVQATFVPYKGGGPAMKALLAGDSDFTMAFPSVVLSQGDALKVLATVGDTRRFDDVPTLAELGYSAGEGTGEMNRVVLAPKGLPADRKAKLWAAFEELNKDKTYQRLMGRLGENTELMPGDDYESIRANQKMAYGKLVGELTK